MAGQADGSVIINTKMDTSGFRGGVANMKKSFDGLGGAIGKIGKIIAGVFAVGKLIQFGKEAIELGSALSEVQNVVDVTFEDLNEEVNAFAKNAITQFGLSETAAKQYTSTMGAMLKSMGLTTREAADMSMTMTGLAADMASFYNLDAEEAFYKIRSGISGETEPLKQLGINMSVANLEAYALTQGINKSYNAMTQQEQAVLRYNYLLSVTADAQGDFARTSESWANQTRVLSEQFKAIKATIGQGLINVFTPILKVINTLLAKLATLANAFKSFTELITGNKSSGSTGGAAAGLAGAGLSGLEDDYNSAAGGAENLASATGDAAEATKDARKEADKYLSGLDEIKRWEAPDTASSGGSGSGGSGGLGAAGAAGVGAVDYGALAKGESVLDSLGEKFKEIFDAVKNGFSDAFVADTGKLVDNINRIKDATSAVWKSEEVQTAMHNFSLQAAETLGAVAGSAASVATSFAVGITGGIASAKEELIEFDKVKISSIFESMTRMDAILEDVAKAASNIATAFEGEGFQKIIEVFTKIADITILSTLDNILGVMSDLWNIAAKPFVDNAEEIEEFLSNITELFSLLLVPIEAVFDMIADKSVAYEDSAIHKFFESISAFASAGFGEVLEKINDKLEDSIEFLKEFLEAWSDGKITLENIWNGIRTSASLAWETIKNFLQGIWQSILESVTEKFMNIYDFILNIFNGIRDIASTIWNRIKITVITAVSAIFSGVHGIFTGIKDTISNIFSSLVGTVRNPINKIIEFLNKLISAAQNAWNKIADFLSFNIQLPKALQAVTGWSSFSLSVPKIRGSYSIPYLAQGAVIPPNAPFAAILGDQKRGTNIEAPLSTIEQAVTNAIRKNGSGGQNMTIRIPVILDGRQIFEAVIDEGRMKQMISGRNPFEMA